METLSLQQLVEAEQVPEGLLQAWAYLAFELAGVTSAAALVPVEYVGGSTPRKAYVPVGTGKFIFDLGVDLCYRRYMGFEQIADGLCATKAKGQAVITVLGLPVGATAPPGTVLDLAEVCLLLSPVIARLPLARFPCFWSVSQC